MTVFHEDRCVFARLYSRHMYSCIHKYPSLMVTLTMTLGVMMVILQEDSLVCAVSSECNNRDTKSREAALKSIPSRELSLVSPRLAVISNQHLLLQEQHLGCLWLLLLTVLPKDRSQVNRMMQRML
jgi:hypothetical protein